MRRFGADRYCEGCAVLGAVEHRDLRFEAEYVFVGRSMVFLGVLGLAVNVVMLVIFAVADAGALTALAPGLLVGGAIQGCMLAIGIGLSRLRAPARLVALGLSVLFVLGCVLWAAAIPNLSPLILAVIPGLALALFAHPRGQRVTSPEYASLLAPELAPAKNPRPYARSAWLVIPIVMPVALMMLAAVACTGFF